MIVFNEFWIILNKRKEFERLAKNIASGIRNVVWENTILKSHTWPIDFELHGAQPFADCHSGLKRRINTYMIKSLIIILGIMFSIFSFARLHKPK